MSTRWYPMYQYGNPQLRVFLPNFWMKLVKSENPTRKNIVQFHVSMEMTRHDVKNYLQKIYQVPVVKVNTRIQLGKIHRNELNTIIKDDDIKVAYVFLPRGTTFEFPKLFENELKKKQDEKTESSFEDVKKEFRDTIKANEKRRPGMPPWFSI